MNSFRIGSGEDIHLLVPERKLILAGVEIPFELGLLGHSDADCVLHAIADSLLGALALGDIGVYFPVNDKKWDNADSKVILKTVYQMVKDKGYVLSNIDVLISCERPHLNPYREKMRESIATLLESDITQVGLQLMTNEGLDAVGQGKAIRASATCLLERID